MVRAVLFDLDDTLYPEIAFARSGMAAVAEVVARRHGVAAAAARAALERALEREPRGRTIDAGLAELGIVAGPGAIRDLVEVYRGHRPHLALHDDAARALDALRARGVALGIVTDGDPAVQRAKAAALGLDRWIPPGHQRFSWDEGVDRQKPHPRAYLGALEAIGVTGAEAAYVGDNPLKDFVGARALGMWTVRIRRGPHRDVAAAEGYEASVALDSLEGLCEILALTPGVGRNP